MTDAKSEHPLNIKAVIDLTVQVSELEEGLEVLNNLQKEFGFTK